MRKHLSIVSMLLVLILLASCGAGHKNTSPPTEPVSQSTPDYDFAGETVRFLVNGQETGSNSLHCRSIALPDGADLSYEINSAIEERNKAVEKDLHVKIELTEITETEQLTQALLASATTGLHTYDVVSGCQYYDIGIPFLGDGKGTLLDLNQLSEEEHGLVLTASYWDKTLSEAMSHNGKMYWVTGDLSLSYLGGLSVSFVNKTLWDRYAKHISELPKAEGESDIYKLVDKKLWTMDLISEISKMIYVDNDVNNKINIGDTVGYISYVAGLDNYMTDVLAAGAGLTYTVYNEAGVPEVGFLNIRSSLFANKLLKQYTESNALLVDPKDGVEPLSVFAKGNVLMIPGYMYQAETLCQDMTDTYIALPPPLLMWGEEYTSGRNGEISMYGIPASAKEANRVLLATATLERMARASKDVRMAYYSSVLRASTEANNQFASLELVDNVCRYDFTLLWAGEIDSPPYWYFRQTCTIRNWTEHRYQKDWSGYVAQLWERLNTP